MSGVVLGIDLGTTNSAVAVAEGTRVQVLADPDGNRLVPSVVSFHPQGDVLVGYPARERRLLDAKNTIYSIKRLIGRPWGSPEVERARERFAFELREGPGRGVLVAARGETYTLPEISAFVLREIRRIAEPAVGAECRRAVITVPANFNELQRAATKAAGKVAGLDVLRILNEPTAAALAYGYGKGARERIAVYDLGGGTFDITILELAGDVFEVLATAGDTFLGGDDIDLLIAEKMADAFLTHHRFDPRQDQQAFERLRAAAEWSKCQLSVEPEVSLRVEELAYGPGGVALDLQFGLARSALETMIAPLVGRTFDVCEEALRIAHLAPTQIDNVILVGGSTRTPLVRQRVAEFFGREPLSSIDPDLVVAQGAALQGFALRAGRASQPPAQAQALGKVALRSVPPPDPRLLARRREVKDENARARPQQPAFAPRPLPPTRTGKGAAVPVVPSPASVSRSDPPRPRTPTAPGVPASAVVVATRQQVVVGTRAPSAPPSRPALPDVQVPASRPSLSNSRPPPASARPPLPVPQARPAWTDEEVPTTPALEPERRSAPPPLPPSVPPPLPPSAPPPAWSPASFDEVPALPPAPASYEPPSQPVLELAVAPRTAPLLLDVTPQTLGVETVGGYCEPVIRRNAAIPVEQTRIFSTASDGQQTVHVRIVQGESRLRDENQALGEILLEGLRQAHRGAVKIGVTFVMDASGTLGVRAKDLETGREQFVRIQLVGGITDDEVRRMQERHQRAL
ncbi:MAG: Hsp70 family protein [Sandaracinus sp.]